MAATSVAVAASAVSFNLFGRPLAASAAVTWGHPFTFYSGRSRGFVGPYPSHAGIDYTPGAGTPIHAVADGTIIISGVSGTGGAYGESIWIQHADGFRTIYAHMQVGTRIPTGPVARGQYIGRVGSTGNSSGPHLHIELHSNNVAINPDPYINSAPLAGGGTGTPQPQPQPILKDDMIRISSPSRGYAIIGPGYFRQLTTQEEIDHAGPIVSGSLAGNDRQFDLWRSMALHGVRS